MDINKTIKLVLILLIGFNVWIWGGLIGGVNVYGDAVYFLDVGQGDAQLVVLDAGKGLSPVKILIDAGEGRKIFDSLDVALGGGNDFYIDILIMTHPHLDHYGGFFHILQRYEVGLFITNGHEEEAEEFERLMVELERNDVDILVLKEGSSISFGRTGFFVLSPDDGLLDAGDLNEASIVIMMEHEGSGAKVLFTGDIGFPAEDILLEKGYDLSADILKVGHHGSKFSTGINFLSAVKPVAGVIGVGNNRFGHPTEEVLEVLELVGADVYRTDEHGTIKVILEGGSDLQEGGEGGAGGSGLQEGGEGGAEGSELREGGEGGAGRIEDLSEEDAGESSVLREENGFWVFLTSIFTGSYLHEDNANMTVLYLDDLRSKEREFVLVPYKTCSFVSDEGRARRSVVINEVAWMGSESGHSHEWIELWNSSGAPVDLSGWQIINENGRIHATFPQKSIFNKEYILLARSGAVDSLNLNADLIFSGAIRNENEGLKLFNNKCELVDSVSAFPRWPAGDNSSKRTMELVSGKWVDSLYPGGTPGKPNTGRFVSSPVSVQVGVASGAVSQNFGCSSGQTNINVAPKAELLKIRHIGDARADGIISARPFSSLQNMQESIKGIGDSRLADILAEGLACVE